MYYIGFQKKIINVFKSEEDQRESIKRQDIERFLETPPTRKELMNYLAKIYAKLELLEIDSTAGLTSEQRVELQHANKDFIEASEKKFRDDFSATAPLSIVL